MIKVIGFAAAGFLFALTGATASASEPDGAETKKEKKVCKSEKVTGSLTRVRRTCMTQSEWDRLAEGSRRNVDTIVRDSSQNQGLSGQ